MFYFDDFCGQKILKSTYLSNVQAYFTTRNETGDFPFSIENLIVPTQTHSSHVDIVGNKKEYQDTDALILTNSQSTIALKFADCTPIIFYDSINKIGAIAHAGWRGTASRISVATVQTMQEKFHTKPQDITVLIGPAIGICCYEVSENIKQALLDTVTNKKGLFLNRNVDLKNINARQLEEIGITNIDICPYCTSCNNDLFYSYRKEKGTTHRHFAVLNLLSQKY